MKENSVCFQFDTILVSPRDFTVRRGEERLELEPKAIRVLLYLVQNRDRVVPKEELVQAVWDGAAITDNAVTRVIAQLRRQLGDDSRSPRYIETVPTLGYRFMAAAREVPNGEVPGGEGEPPPAAAQPRRRPRWTIPLGIVATLALTGSAWWFRRADRPAFPPSAPPVQITTTPGVDSRPSFGPDGRSFVYCSNKNGSFQIYRRELASEARVRALTDDGHQTSNPPGPRTGSGSPTIPWPNAASGSFPRPEVSRDG